MRHHNDIKAPDGFLLGGVRRVRKDGTILFQRGWWKCPDEWIGKDIWVHEHVDGGPFERMVKCGVEAAPPGIHIYEARLKKRSIVLEPADRPDARPGYRTAANKAWVERCRDVSHGLVYPRSPTIGDGDEP